MGACITITYSLKTNFRSDKFGRATIKIHKNSIPCKMKISYIGNVSCIIEINDFLNKDFTIYLPDVFRSMKPNLIKGGEVLKYKFEYVSPDLFKIWSDKEWIYYKRRKVDKCSYSFF